MQKKFLRTVVKAVIVGALCCSMGDVVAQGNVGIQQRTVKVQQKQSGYSVLEDVKVSLNGERILDKKSLIQKGNTINVNVAWSDEYVKKVVFDSACFVRKLTPEEQERTGKTEELIRDKSFVPYVPTPEEIKKGKYAFSVKPQVTMVYFYTSYWYERTPSRRYTIKVADKNGQELYYQKPIKNQRSNEN